MREKNADYAGSQDPFANFKLTEAARLCSAQQGILIRMLDKVSRLSTHAGGQALKTDSMKDSVIDIINYAILFYGMETINVPANPQARQSDSSGGNPDSSNSGQEKSL
jgi:hypothetical protein